MAVPRRKTSPSRRGMRRSADALKKPTYVEDKDSGELRRPHHLDLKTGMYKGRQGLKKKESWSGLGIRHDFDSWLPEFGQRVGQRFHRAKRCFARGTIRLSCEGAIPMVGFPLLLIPLAIYNIIVFLMPDVSFTDPLVKLTLVSGAEWTVT